MLHRIILALLSLLLPATAFAQDMEGAWDLRLDDTTIFRFELESVDAAEWRGTWQRPESFRTDGNAFGSLSGSVERVESMAGYEFLGLVELSFDDPRPGALPDIFRFEQIDANSARMTYVGTDLAPYMLMRAGPDDAIGDWDETRIFRRPRSVAEEFDAQVSAPTGPALLQLTPLPAVPPVPEAAEAEPVSQAQEANAEDGAAGEMAQELPGIEAADQPNQADQADVRIGADFLDGF